MGSDKDTLNTQQSQIEESERRQIQETVFHLESEKQQAEERYKHLFDNALVGLFRIRLSDGVLLDINREAVHIFGYESVDEFRGLLINNSSLTPFLFSPERVSEAQKGEPINYTINATGRKGETVWAQVSIRYLPDSDLIEGAVKDITDLILIQEQLKNSIEAEKTAKAEAEHASLAKSQFLANVSHEIRTPLNSIMGFSEIILSSDNLETHKKHTREILAESEKLMTLINQLLDLSKIEAEGIRLEKSLFRFADFIADTLRPVNVIIREKKLDMIVNLSRDVPEQIFGDPFRLRQILLNLISNAIKFTEKGYIRLTINLKETTDHTVTLHFQVEDTGMGIPQELINRIFDNFIQGHPMIAHNYGGTGLGLPIAKKLVNLMGGELTVSSNPGKGSVFEFTAEFERPDTVPVKDKPLDTQLTEEVQGSIKNSRILVCEDYVTNQQIVYHHLDQVGCDITIVENGLKGLEEIRRNNYDLILMDLQMPVMDGLEATRRIRELEKGRDIPIIGMTAAAFSKDRENSLKAGMSDFITKPIRRNVLINKVKRWILGHDIPGDLLPAPDEQPLNAPASDHKTLRPEDFQDETGMNRDQALTVWKGFIANSREKITQATDLLRFGNDDEIAEIFHALKGAAAGITADRLSALCRYLEYAINAQDRLLVREKLPELEKALLDLEQTVHRIAEEKN